MLPKPRILVDYRLTADDATAINKHRSDALLATASNMFDGTQVHIGQAVKAGEDHAMLITRVVEAKDGGKVNGQVILDGNDSLFVAGAVEGTTNGRWRAGPMTPGRSAAPDATGGF